MKTVQRDIKYLRDCCHAPIMFSRSRGGYCYENPEWSWESMEVSEGDLFALLVAKQAVDQYRGTRLGDKLDKIYKRVADTLLSKVTADTRDISWAVSTMPAPVPPVKAQVWSAVLQGLLERRSLRLRYRSAWNPKADEVRVINPDHVVNLQGEWYVLAGTPDQPRPEKYQYSMARIESAVVTRQKFEIPPDFNAKELLKGTFGRFVSDRKMRRVRILFDKKIAPLVDERKWLPIQDMKPRKDGSIEISFKVSAAGAWPFYHVKSWILSWGRHAKVLGPKELRQLVAEEIKIMGRFCPQERLTQEEETT